MNFLYNKKEDLYIGIIFILVVSAVAHFLFSSLGFNPTDDGFVLAGTRRILDGQVPYRDFITIRPLGQYLLHLPFVKFGGDYTFWISRYFVWFQFACIAWIWMIFINRFLGVFYTLKEKLLSALFVFFLSVHQFPIMAWSTIDGLFFLSVGLLLLSSRNSKWIKIIGYLLIGTAPLCKQGFLLLIPAALIFFKDWHKIRFWLAAALPTLIMLVYLAFNGAIPEAIQQITSHGNLWLEKGLVSFLTQHKGLIPWGIILGYLMAKIADGKFTLEKMANKRNWFVSMGILFFLVMPVVGTLFLLTGPLNLPSNLYYGVSFGFLGLVIGLILYFIGQKRQGKLIPLGIFVALIAWSTSLSIGYSNPALASGPLMLFIFSVGLLFYRQELLRNLSWLPKFFPVLIITSLIIMPGIFGIARWNFIYRDLSAPQLTKTLDDVLPGGKLIKTNPTTYAVLVDLQTLKNQAVMSGRKYCILPAFAANWVKDPQPNPLPIDWAESVELSKPALVNWTIEELEAQRGKIIVIVQKFDVSSLAQRFDPLIDYDRFEIVRYVHSNFNKIGESQFFDLYE